MKNLVHSKTAGLLGLLGLAALALTAVSCASIDATTSQYAGAPHYPPSNPAAVQILRSEPGRPHQRLGEVVLDTTTDPTPPIADVEERMREEAAKIGADAAVIVYDRIQPMGMYVTGGYWNRSVETVTGRKLIGVAIKYQSQSLTPTGATGAPY